MVSLALRSDVILFGVCWWINSSGIWKHAELKAAYIGSCRDPSAANFAAEGLRHYRITELCKSVPTSATALAIAA